MQTCLLLLFAAWAVLVSRLIVKDETKQPAAKKYLQLAIGDSVTARFRQFAGRLVPYFEKVNA